MLEGIYDQNEKSLIDNYPGRRPDTLGVTYKLDSRLEAAWLTGAKYFLEIRDSDGATKAFYAFPYDPVSVSYERPTAAKFTHTMDGSYIREFSSIKNTMINISGVTGIKKRLIVNRFGGLVYASGKDAYIELDEFLKQYHEFCSSKTSEYRLSRDVSSKYKQYRKNKKDGGWRMVFHSLEENISYFVEPLSFNASKDIARFRHSYGYNLQLKAYAYDQQKLTDFSLFGDIVNTLNAGINSVAFFAAFGAAALNGFDSQVTGQIRGILSNTANAIQEYSNTLDTIGSTIGNIVRIASDVAVVKSELAGTWNNLVTGDFLSDVVVAANNVSSSWTNSTEFIDPFSSTRDNDPVLSPQPVDNTESEIILAQTAQSLSKQLEKDPELFFDLISSGLINEFVNSRNPSTESESFYKSFSITAELRYQVELMKGYLTLDKVQDSSNAYKYLGQFLANDEGFERLAANSGFSSLLGSDNNAYSNYTSYSLGEGETLLEVAFKMLGDEDSWVILKDINSWVSFDRNAKNAPPAIGETINIPAVASLQVRQNPLLSSRTKEDLLGVDLALNVNDLKFNGDDLLLNKGVSNLEQNVVHRVLTLKGEIPNLSSFGLEELIGSKASEASIDYIKLMISKSLLSDTRINSIYDVKVNTNGNQVDFTCKVKTIINTETEIIIPIN